MIQFYYKNTAYCYNTSVVKLEFLIFPTVTDTQGFSCKTPLSFQKSWVLQYKNQIQNMTIFKLKYKISTLIFLISYKNTERYWVFHFLLIVVILPCFLVNLISVSYLSKNFEKLQSSSLLCWKTSTTPTPVIYA